MKIGEESGGFKSVGCAVSGREDCDVVGEEPEGEEEEEEGWVECCCFSGEGRCHV